MSGDEGKLLATFLVISVESILSAALCAWRLI